ncbi:polymorphic toxin-type HINT domain-containing protein, partial [Kitasatospora sp. NPDC049285]|uniref:polymorphic toxin-type HINT domain-containing protein n=1 Tax=Kitasatospora sp. NPDC049285 TaxID=3157096 RepID=UPI0034406F92
DEATYDPATGLSGTRYYPMPNGITAVRTGATILNYQISDHHGTGTIAIDSATLQVTRRPADPFGNPRGTQPTTWAGDHGFVNGTKDDTTGLTNLGAREYQPTLGRFLSLDPLLDAGDPQQWNGYAYSNNDPVNLSDPTGLYRVEGQDGGSDGTLAPGTTGEVPCDQSEACKHWQEQIDQGKKITTTILDQIPQDRLKKFRDHLKLIMKESPNDWNVPGTSAYAALQRYADDALYGPLTLKDLWDGAKGSVAGLVVGLVGVALCPESGGAGCALAVGAMAGFASQCATNCSDKEALALSTVAGAATAYAGVKLGGVGVKVSGCSFSPDTPVLLDDGETKPIGDIAIGDHVEAGDPTTGEHVGSREVTALHVNHDDDLIDLTVSTPDGRSVVVHTTARHPFWDDTQKKWVPAGKLTNGDALETSANAHAYVRGVALVNGTADMFNLTVADLHTYYVLAGTTPVLVHNINCNLFTGEGWQHVLNEHVDGSPGVTPGNTTFSNYVADLDEIGELIAETAKTPGRPNYPDAAGRPRDGTVHTHDFGYPVGSRGETSVEVVLNPDGSLRTAYPR